MGNKSKRKRSVTRRNRKGSGDISNLVQQNRPIVSEKSYLFGRKRRFDTGQLTRDTMLIANPDTRLSLAAEDLRTDEPFKTNRQHRVFKNVDGTPANTSYKDVPIKKKDIIYMVGEVFIVLLILVGLWCVGEDMSDGVCYLPTVLLDMVRDAVRDLLGVQNGLNSLT